VCNLLHAFVRDPTNSGYVSDCYICPSCLCRTIHQRPWLVLERLAIVTPTYLAGLFDAPVSEPVCRDCRVMFQWYR